MISVKVHGFQLLTVRPDVAHHRPLDELEPAGPLPPEEPRRNSPRDGYRFEVLSGGGGSGRAAGVDQFRVDGPQIREVDAEAAV